MDYNEKEGIKKAMNFDGTVNEWVDLMTSLKVANKINLINNYYFDNEGNLYLRNKKHAIKRGKYSEFASMDLNRVDNYHELKVTVGVITFSGKLSIKNFTVKFNDVNLGEFLVEFINNFKVNKLYVDGIGVSEVLQHILTNLGYTIDDDYNLIKNNYLTEELSKLPNTSNITILNYDGLMIARSNKDTLLNLETLKNFKFVSMYEVYGEYYIIVSKI